MEENKKDIILVSIFLLLFFLIRSLFYRYGDVYTLDSLFFLKQAFSGDITTNYSYFLSLFNDLATINIVLSLILFFSLFFTFYTFIKLFERNKDKILYMLLILTSPLLIINTKLGNYDRNLIVLSLILTFFTLLFKYFKTKNSIEERLFFIFFSLIISFLYFIWRGTSFLLLIFFPLGIFYLIKLKINGKKLISLVFILVISLITIFFQIKSIIISYLFSPTHYLISELNPIYYIGFFPLFILGLFFYFIIIRDIGKNNIFFINYKVPIKIIILFFFLISFIGTFFMFRLNIFYIASFILFFPIIFNYMIKTLSKKKRNLFRLFLLLFVIFNIFVSSYYYTTAPYNNKDVEEVIEYINNINNTSCIYSFWDNGHILYYYSNKTIIQKGSPIGYDYDFYVNGKADKRFINCTFFLDINDCDKIKYMAFVLYKQKINCSDIYAFNLQFDKNFSNRYFIKNKIGGVDGSQNN